MSFVAVAIGISAVGLGLTAYGTYTNMQATRAQTGYQREAIELQKQQQTLEMQQNTVNSVRQQRQMIREGIISRSKNLATAVNQGSQLGSGLEGALATDAAQVAGNVGAVGQNLAFGQKNYQLKQSISDAYSAAAAAGGQAAFGAGLASLGGAMVRSQGTVERVGSYIQKRLFD